MRYDCLIVLGSQPDLQTWEFPEQIHECIRTAAELARQKVTDRIIVSGKWSRRIEDQDLGQPFVECDRLADLLIAEGIDERMILREGESTDTISNLYYVKKELLIPRNFRKVLFVVAAFRIQRLRFLVRKVFGPEYQADYESVPGEEGPIYNEALTMARTREFLAAMADGDHEWLTNKFFNDPFYKKVTDKHLAEMQND